MEGEGEYQVVSSPYSLPSGVVPITQALVEIRIVCMRGLCVVVTQVCALASSEDSESSDSGGLSCVTAASTCVLNM